VIGVVTDAVSDLVLGATVLLVPLILVSLALVLVIRLAVRGELRRGLGYVFLLPNRRLTLFYLGAVTLVLFLIGGVVNGLTLLDVLSEASSDIGIAVADVGASGALLAMLFYGLRPTALTTGERAALAREPMALAALGLVQSMQDDER
jgi:hypothetical protein